MAGLRHEHKVVFHLDRSRFNRLAESTLGRLLPLAKHRRPKGIVAVSAEPVFGRDLYAALSRAKIVLNGAVDMAGADRGNMRCFEAMGCGALMVSDQGLYPEGMSDGVTMLTYADPHQAVEEITTALITPDSLHNLVVNGNRLVQTLYSKDRQWQSFQHLVG